MSPPRRSVACLVAGLLWIALASPVGAADIVIDDPRWGTLSKQQQDEIVARLKAAKAIEADDRIVYKPPKANTVTEKNLSPLSAGPAIAAAICRIRNLMTRSECAKVSDAAARKSCQEAEKARYDAIKSACK